MARKPPSQNTTRPEYQFRFVPGSLTDAQKAACKKWQFDAGDFVNTIHELSVDGYKFTCSSDPNGPGMVAYMVPRDKDHKHYGHMLSGRGSDVLKAFKQLFYRHFVIFETDWIIDSGQLSPEDYND